MHSRSDFERNATSSESEDSSEDDSFDTELQQQQEEESVINSCNEDKEPLFTWQRRRDTPLLLASANGHLDAVSALLSREAQIDTRNKWGNTPLQMASNNGHDNVVLHLLDKGAEIDSCNNSGNTSLQLAAAFGHDRVVSILLGKGAQVDSCNENKETSLYLAAANGHVSTISALLDHGADIESREYDEGTPLLQASTNGNLGAVSALLSRKAQIDTRNKWGNTPLQMASNNGHENVVLHLLDKGAEIDSCNNSGNTSLQLAAAFGHDRVVSILLGKGAQIDSCNESGNTSLQLAAESGHDRVMFTLLSRRAAVDSCNKTGNTALQLACAKNHHSTVRILLSFRAAVDAGNHEGYTPLHFAAEEDDAQTVALLLSHQADPTRFDNYGRTPIFSASSLGQHKNVEMLINNGADVNAKTYRGLTPLHGAVGWAEGKEESTRLTCLIQLLITNGAKVDGVGGNSPLHMACEEVHAGAIECLVRHGADVNRKDAAGKTPFQLALEADDIEPFKPVVFERPGILRKDEAGRSALHEASLKGHLKNVQDLLHDISFELPALETFHMSPSGLAIAQDHREVSLCLLTSDLYYPGSCLRRYTPLATKEELSMIEACLLNYSSNPTLSTDELDSIVYWMIANKSRYLTNASFPGYASLGRRYRGGASLFHIAARYSNHDLIQTVLFNHDYDSSLQDDDGNTALHAAAAAGNLNFSKALLEKPAHSSQQIIDLIIQPNCMRESPFSLAVKWRHSSLRDYFRLQLTNHTLKRELLQDPDSSVQVPTRVTQAQELIFRFEKPGIQDRLLQLQKTWLGEPRNEICDKVKQRAEKWGILPTVVYHNQAVALWWLLSNGWVFDQKEIDLARKVLEALPGTEKNSYRDVLSQLLQNPPQIVEQAGLTDSHRVPGFPSRPSDFLLGNANVAIIDFYALRDVIDLHMIERSLDDIIYDQKLGPQRLMTESLASRHRDLHSFKRHLEDVDKRYREMSTAHSSRDQNPLPRDTSDAPATGALQFRWIHLPFNHVVVMNRTSFEWNDTPSASEQETSHHEIISIQMPYLNKAVSPLSQPDRLDSGLHQPMTLDQFYYQTLEDSTVRDIDQVVVRWAECMNHEIQQPKRSTAAQEYERRKRQEYLREPGKQILAVDQIWIRILDNKTIVTSCTNPEDSTEARLPERIRRFIMLNDEKEEFQRPKTTKAMAEIVLTIMTTLILDQKFSRSLPKVDQETSKGKNALEIFQESVRDLNESHTHEHTGFIRDLPKNPYHIIDDEAHLLREAKDIRDELNIFKAVLEGQQQVWQQTFETEDLDTFAGFQYSHPMNPTRMLCEIQRIADEVAAVQESINALLELRQQQAGIKDAEFGRWQANDTAKQANISLIFTVVAILFLPLSFLTSLFALNVTDFPHPNGDLEFQGKWIFPIIFCTSACISIPFLLFAFNVNRAVHLWNLITSRKSHKLNQPKNVVEAEDTSLPPSFSNSVPRRLGDKAELLRLIRRREKRMDSERGYREGD
ncbi:hypothetical protein N7495_004678 [Penicillium taxi]|uniref:uncharacterized protein n=1 Tax=Penicillium taxi TaxID=168475 RepID=UPI0025452038|nr:uncharacterized protein N7495_004678 [Penicillium taxi]KAJ5899934.1 hypothetical protein N7495_004678 [Penicillium taxi]